MAQDADVDPRVKQALFCLHYGYPTAVFAYYIISTTLAVCTLQTKSAQENHGRRRFILWLLVLIILTFVAQLIDLGIRSFIQHTLPAEQHIIIGLLSCILVFGVEFAGLVHSKAPVWYPFIGSFVIALLFEPLIAALSFLARPPSTLTYSDILTISITAARYLALTLAVAAHIEATCSFRREKGTDAERQGLLKASNSSSTTDVSASQDGENPTNGYGSTSTTPTDESSSPSNDRIESPYERRQRQAAELMEKRLKEKGNWVTYAKSFMVRFHRLVLKSLVRNADNFFFIDILSVCLARRQPRASVPSFSRRLLLACHELHPCLDPTANRNCHGQSWGSQSQGSMGTGSHFCRSQAHCLRSWHFALAPVVMDSS